MFVFVRWCDQKLKRVITSLHLVTAIQTVAITTVSCICVFQRGELRGEKEMTVARSVATDNGVSSANCTWVEAMNNVMVCLLFRRPVKYCALRWGHLVTFALVRTAGSLHRYDSVR